MFEKFEPPEAAPPQKHRVFNGGGVIFEKFEPPEAAPPQKHRAFMVGCVCVCVCVCHFKPGF